MPRRQRKRGKRADDPGTGDSGSCPSSPWSSSTTANICPWKDPPDDGAAAAELTTKKGEPALFAPAAIFPFVKIVFWCSIGKMLVLDMGNEPHYITSTQTRFFCTVLVADSPRGTCWSINVFAQSRPRWTCCWVSVSKPGSWIDYRDRDLNRDY